MYLIYFMYFMYKQVATVIKIYIVHLETMAHLEATVVKVQLVVINLTKIDLTQTANIQITNTLPLLNLKLLPQKLKPQQRNHRLQPIVQQLQHQNILTPHTHIQHFHPIQNPLFTQLDQLHQDQIQVHKDRILIQLDHQVHQILRVKVHQIWAFNHLQLVPQLHKIQI
jgi:hypothetical protein